MGRRQGAQRVSGQGPTGPGAGRGIAVRQFSPLQKKGEGLPPLPPTYRGNTGANPVSPKTPAVYGVFCSSHFGLMLGQAGPMLSHRAHLGPILAQVGPMLGYVGFMLGPCWAYVEPMLAYVGGQLC